MKTKESIYPLGVIKTANSLKISFFSKGAKEVSIALYYPTARDPFQIIPLRKETESLWHLELPLLPPETEYLFQVDGAFVLDPYAKALSTSSNWGDPFTPRCQLTFDHTFDWEGIKPPGYSLNDLIIYEMHVRGFTQSETSQVNCKGKFLGVIEKLPYLKNLGINAIELLPIHEFDETESPFIHPLTKEPLCNYWGYMTVSFFVPMKRYATNSERLTALTEFKTLIKECHRYGIEVILDVVYNHVSKKSPLPLIDKESYFILSETGEDTNYTGCGNTINGNSPASIDLILASLRYFVEECHVDGFRFDLAGALTRDATGAILKEPPLFEALAKESCFHKTKLFLEPWDAGGAFLLDHFPMENASLWNGNYKTDVRKFMKGELHNPTLFEEALLGAPSLCKEKSPNRYVHYITCHDGFTLRDLVSYQDKHNENNGEENRDGENYNFSFNCGLEGETFDPTIRERRLLEMLNFHLINLLSRGIPMVVMGDEVGLTHHGNNNAYCHDIEWNWMNWQEIETREGAILYAFVEKAIALRKELSHLFSNRPLKEKEVKVLRKEKDLLILLLQDEILFASNRTDHEIDLSTLLEGQFDTLLATKRVVSFTSLILAPKATLITKYKQ